MTLRTTMGELRSRSGADEDKEKRGYLVLEHGLSLALGAPSPVPPHPPWRPRSPLPAPEFSKVGSPLPASSFRLSSRRPPRLCADPLPFSRWMPPFPLEISITGQYFTLEASGYLVLEPGLSLALAAASGGKKGGGPHGGVGDVSKRDERRKQGAESPPC
jgi:hypothetical protein